MSFYSALLFGSERSQGRLALASYCSDALGWFCSGVRVGLSLESRSQWCIVRKRRRECRITVLLPVPRDPDVARRSYSVKIPVLIDKFAPFSRRELSNEVNVTPAINY